MRFFIALLFFISPLAAQTRFEGTLTQSQNGFSQVAQIRSEAPDKLRVETPRAILLASGTQTQIYDKPTRRLKVWSGNLARLWSRGHDLLSGGPLNFALFDARTTGQLGEEFGVLTRDKTFFGGGGKTAFYATFKTRRELYPARTEVSPALRVEKNSANRELFRATLQLQNDVPQSAQSGEVTWKYDLKPRAEAFGAEAFSLPAGALPEAGDAGVAPSDFDRAFDLWRGTFDARGALDALQRLPETASAPALAAFEIALSVGDFARAGAALDRAARAKIDEAELQVRRARFFEAARDWTQARAAWEAASKAAPADFEIVRARANFLRSLGEIAPARALWQTILEADNAPPETRLLAAGDFALYSAPSEWKTLRETVRGTGEAARLARALLSLREREIPTETFSSERAQTLFALGLERAGELEKAQALWVSLEKSANLEIADAARLRLMVLGALRNDLSASIAQFQALEAVAVGEIERDNLRRAFFEAWQKSFRRVALGKSLEARAGATRSSEADAKLWVAYAEFYGEREALERALENGRSRYGKSAFWHSKNAELLLGQALPLRHVDPVQAARRDRLYTQIFASLDAAIAAAPDQPFYKMQRVLAFAQRAANLGVTDSNRSVAERKLAREAAENLVAQFPRDPDALVCAAIALLSFDAEAGARRAVELGETALATLPFDGPRQTLAFAARQTIWNAREKLGDFAGAQKQSVILVESAQNASEAAQLLNQQFGFFERAGATENAPALAAIVMRAARGHFDLESSRALLDALTKRALQSPARAEILAALRDNASPQSALTWANFAYWRLEAAKTALSKPGAPGSADAELERATRDLNGAATTLAPIARSDDPLLSAPVAVFLSERAGLSPEEGQNYLQMALKIEPRALGVRLAWLENLTGEKLADERLKTLQSFAFDWEGTRQMVALLWGQEDDAGALALGQELYGAAQSSGDARANDFQRAAFTVAKILFAKNPALAAPIYTGLSEPDWALLDRAAALLAWRQKWLDMGRETEAARLTEKIAALGVETEELEQAADFVAEAEN